MNNKEKLLLAKLAATHAPGSVGAFFEPDKAAPQTYAALPTAKGGLSNIPPRPAAHPLSKQTSGVPDPKGWQRMQARKNMGLPVTQHAPYPSEGDKMLAPNTPPVLPAPVGSRVPGGGRVLWNAPSGWAKSVLGDQGAPAPVSTQLNRNVPK